MGIEELGGNKCDSKIKNIENFFNKFQITFIGP